MKTNTYRQPQNLDLLFYYCIDLTEYLKPPSPSRLKFFLRDRPLTSIPEVHCSHFCHKGTEPVIRHTPLPISPSTALPVRRG